MAKYKESWISPINSTVIGYVNTETGGSINLVPQNPFDQAFQQWLTDGGIPDPAFTQQEIDDYQAEHDRLQDIEDEQSGSGIRGLTVDEAKQIVTDRIDLARDLPDSNLAEIQAKILALCNQTEWLFHKVVVFLLK